MSADPFRPPGHRARTLRLVAFLVLAAALVTGGILWTRERRQRELRIEGRTVDSSGTPVPDAQITLEIGPAESEEELPVERVATRSDAAGRFSIRYRLRWSHPIYNLEASKTGFEPVTIDDADALPSPLTLRFVAAR
jgi:hypothetical protein